MADKGYPTDIKTLTTLRFFAAIWVVLYHYVWWLTSDGQPTLDLPIISQGKFGVDFFFILSGFILTHAHYTQIRQGQVRFGRFMVKRFARIYPLHLATILFYIFLIGVLKAAHMSLPNPERYSATQLVLNLLLVHAWQIRDAGAWNFPSWSISAEWFAYLLFPALATLLVRTWATASAGRIAAGALILFFVAVTTARPLFGVDLFSLHSNFGWFRILPEFILGIALYRVGHDRAIAWLGKKLWLGVAICTTLAVSLLRLELLTVFSLIMLIMISAELSRQDQSTILADHRAIYLGKISFALYMVHLPVATIVLRGSAILLGATSAWMIAPALILAIIVAILAHHLIEVPVNRWLVTRFAGRTEARNLAL